MESADLLVRWVPRVCRLVFKVVQRERVIHILPTLLVICCIRVRYAVRSHHLRRLRLSVPAVLQIKFATHRRGEGPSSLVPI